jgi:hypothetical protein
VGPRAVLDAVVKRKIPSLRRESNSRTPIVQPVAQRYTDPVPRLRMRGAIPPLPQYVFMALYQTGQEMRLDGMVPSYTQRQVYFYLIFTF